MITIRSAHEDDVMQVAQIGLRAWEDATASLGVTEELRQNARNAFMNFTSNSWVSIRIAELDGVTCGWTARENFDENITDFWVDPDCLRQGVGTALLADLENSIRAQNYEEARLESHAQNDRALEFFRKNGYSVSWLSVTYSPKLDRDVHSVGLAKSLVPVTETGYGSEF